MSLTLQPATELDFPAIVAVMNAAFRGAEGWSIEADYITGVRTSDSLLREEIAKGALYLIVRDGTDSGLQGCVSLQASSTEKWYLGALTVRPAQQNSGFGRKLLEAAESYAANHGARTIEMTVVNVRETLIAWYERRGYLRTGKTRPFPYGDNRYGTPTRDDLEFVVLSKAMVTKKA
jgi:ribosomal protein S18 acetylase RimI-like enzyme